MCMLPSIVTVNKQGRNVSDIVTCYITPWTIIKVDARRALVDFIIDAILPDVMREQFSAVRLNIVQTDKLLDIVRPIVAA